MARGDFLRGLSSGIFGELNEQEKLQTAREQQQQGQTIQMLAGLADKIEPESLPLLMGHIWDTMGIKRQGKSGKGLRGFLDAFSGVPNRSFEDQLGSKFKEITEGSVGPAAARGIRQRGGLWEGQAGGGNLGAMMTPRTPEEAATKAQGQADLAGLEKKMVFRDPYREEIGKIQTRYEGQLQSQEDRQRHAFALQAEAAKNREEAAAEKYNRQTTLGVDRLAQSYMGDPEIRSLPPAFQVMAAQEKARRLLYGTEELRGKDIQSRIDYRKDILQEKKVGTPAQKLGEKRFAASQDETRRKLETAVSDAQAKVATYGPMIEEMEKSLDATAKQAKLKDRHELLSNKLYAFGSPHMGPASTAVKEYRDAIKARAAAQATVQTTQRQLEEFNKKRATGGAVRPPQATKKSIGDVSRAGVGTTGIRVRKEQGVREGYMPSDIREVAGKKYVVKELSGDWWILTPYKQ